MVAPPRHEPVTLDLDTLNIGGGLGPHLFLYAGSRQFQSHHIYVIPSTPPPDPLSAKLVSSDSNFT